MGIKVQTNAFPSLAAISSHCYIDTFNTLLSFFDWEEFNGDYSTFTHARDMIARANAANLLTPEDNEATKGPLHHYLSWMFGDTKNYLISMAIIPGNPTHTAPLVLPPVAPQDNE